jgi:hypothetical protein
MGSNDVLAAASWRAFPRYDVPQVALHLLAMATLLIAR